ncbi:hypothetical protein Agabi119p4_7018 [Agaricus bisporus var. burnettii]|uniref:Uncharacterized protein n=1 Tax=Agaricus bisporus var. burnettii TaxID=192524 RepID=A0A8H7F0L1_AGABI|nr:hypothetical protein Agabi119p4_7018 [Agaricus bisporus var. burnettii]
MCSRIANTYNSIWEPKYSRSIRGFPMFLINHSSKSKVGASGIVTYILAMSTRCPPGALGTDRTLIRHSINSRNLTLLIYHFIRHR